MITLPSGLLRSDINTHTWRKNTPIHRVHDSAYAANSFNPCKGRGTRFAPFDSPAGKCVATLYGGGDFTCSVYETIFHDVPFTAPDKSIPAADVHSKAYSELRPKRELILADLTTVGLRKPGISRAQLIESEAVEYKHTVLWAKALHGQFAHLDGLYWISQQYDRGRALMLFGERVKPTDLAVHAGPQLLEPHTALEEFVQQLANQAGIEIVP